MSAPPLPGVFAGLAPVLEAYGYLAVAGVVFLEDFGVPVPGETILIAAAVYAGAGQLNIVFVAGLALLAAVAGDNVGYAIGYLGGRRLVVRFGRFVALTPPRLEAAEGFFTRHGGKIVVVARFVEGLRQLNGVLAGISGLAWRRFLVFNAVGAALWVGVWAGLGYLAGTNLGPLYDQVRRYQLYVLLALAAAFLALITRRVWRRHTAVHRRDVEHDRVQHRDDRRCDHRGRAGGGESHPGPRNDASDTRPDTDFPGKFDDLRGRPGRCQDDPDGDR